MTATWEAGVRDPARLAAVVRSGLVGIEPGDNLDRLIELAIAVTGAPRGCVTLVDSEHTTALSARGFPEGLVLAAPIELSLCKFVVASGRPLVVDDSRADPRTVGDPAIDAFDAGAWAGYPIEDTSGMVLGTFCLMDPEPHPWTDSDLYVLATLAAAASTEIALRITRAEVEAVRVISENLRAASARDAAALEASLDHLVRAGDLAGPARDALLLWIEGRGRPPGTPDAEAS